MANAGNPLSVLQIFRSVVDDPMPRFSSIGAGTIATARPGEADVSSDRLSSIVGREPESANNNFAKTKMTRSRRPGGSSRSVNLRAPGKSVRLMRARDGSASVERCYGSAETLNWIVTDKKIAPHIPVIDKSNREDGTFSRADFIFDKDRNAYVCPNGKLLHTTGTVHDGYALRYRASKSDCDACALKTRCCPNTPMRYVPRDLHEDARDVARALAKTEAFEQSRRYRKRVEMRFAHLKRILRLGRLRLRGPRGAQDEFTLAAIAQNLRRLAKLIARPPPAAAPCAA